MPRPPRKCPHCGDPLDPQEHCDCIVQQMIDAGATVGVDLASGEDVTVAYNPVTKKREIIQRDSNAGRSVG